MITLDFIINAISLGSTYALLSLGMVIVYGILKLVNFAYGELLMIAGYSLFVLGLGPHLPWIIMAILAVGVAVLTSYLTERVAFRPVRENSLTAMLITSFAVSTLLQNAALLIISPRARAVPLPAVFSESAMVLGQSVPIRNILAIVTSVSSSWALVVVFRQNRARASPSRAASDNFRMTRMLGCPRTSSSPSRFCDERPLAGGWPCSGWAAPPP